MAVIDELKILVTAEVAQAVANLNKVEGASNKAGGGFKDFAKSIAGYTTAAGLAVSATKAIISGVVNLTKESISLAMGFETAKISWGVLLGDMEDGEKMFSKIQALAAKTPLSFESVEQGARTLKQFGLATVDIIPTIKMLGDVSAGNADKLRGLSIVYGQIMSTGRLMGQDLLQLINQGFNPLQIISKKTGESMAELKARMEKGGISAQEVADAFKTATSEGGLFYGMMDKTAKTASGQLSTAIDNVKMRMAEFGDSLLKVVTPALKAFNEEMDRMAARKGVIKAIDLGFAAGAEALKQAIDDFKKIAAEQGYTTEEELQAVSDEYDILKKAYALAVARESAEKSIVAAKEKQASDAAAAVAAAKKAEADRVVNDRARIETWAAMNDAAQGYFKLLETAEDNAQKNEADNARAMLATWAGLDANGRGYIEMLNAIPEAWAKAKAATDLYTNSVWDANEADAQSSVRLNFSKDGKADTKSWDKYIEKLKEVRSEEEQMIEIAEILGSAMQDAFEGIGEALMTGESGWKAFGKAGLQAISAIIEGFAKQYAALAIAEAFTPGMQGAAIGHAAAAAGLYVAAGAVKAIPLAEGGIVKARPGGTIARIGEGGQDEAVIPLKRGRGLGVTVIQNISGSVWNTRQLRQLAVDAVATADAGY